MKKLLNCSCLFLLLFLFGCNSSSFKKTVDTYNSYEEKKLEEQLLSEEKYDDGNVIKTVENPVTNEKNLETTSFVENSNQNVDNVMIEDEELKEYVSSMSIEELLDFTSQYKSISYCNYWFINYTEDIDVTIKLKKDYSEIVSVHIYHKIPLDSDIISKIEVGMKIEQVIEMIGNPNDTFTSGINSLAFAIDEDTVIVIQLIDTAEDLIVIHVNDNN